MAGKRYSGGEEMEQSEMPVGLAMALAMNPEAMHRFTTLSEEQKSRIIEGTHGIRSRDEMHRYVSSIAADK